MTTETDKNEPVTIDNASGDVLPTRTKKVDLKSINDVRLEMANVYRSMKSGEIQTSDGTKLCYVLGQIGKMIEEHEIEKRIELLEASQNERIASPKGRNLADFYNDVSNKPDDRN